jgi:hypothetical protein
VTVNSIEELLRAIDPSIEMEEVTESRQDEIWSNIIEQLTESLPRQARRVRRLWSVGTFGGAIAVTVTLLTTLGSAPTSAVAATLQAAATAGTHLAVLPTLSPGQFYYQASQVSLVCQVTSPQMRAGESPLTYVANGTVESWTANDGSGKVVVSPSAVGTDGSHFATSAERARWVALGKPFIPCALGDASNQLGGNQANANSQSNYGGYATTVSGYAGFGLSLASTPLTSLLASASGIDNFPQNPSQISTLLASGQINVDGSISPTSQVCPILDGSNVGTSGCDPYEQLAILEQLLQVPNASAKLGSVLYQVLETLPSAKLAGSVTDASGLTGTAVQVSLNPGETFQAVIDPTTGALQSCSEFLTTSGATSTIGSINYGPVEIAQGQGVVPPQLLSGP